MGGKTVAKSVGITKDVHVHSLRHTYATHLLEDAWILSRSKTFWATKTLTTLEY
jgi:site-specific recombinase XerC